MPIDFKQDILHGLRSSQKSLPSKYFYDEQGDALFQQIMQLEEYYLPGCEREIIENEAKNIAQLLLQDAKHWNIIELGAGDGSKTIKLLKRLLDHGISAEYTALDISSNVLKINSQNMREALPDLKIKTVPGNYYRTFHSVPRLTTRNLIIYMGSNIGNYNLAGAQKFLHWLKMGMTENDLAMIAFDLKKHPKTILDAYNDSQGITEAFNLNLLSRINRELGADFNLEKFDHYPYYEPVTGTAYSFLVSLEDQSVTIDGNKIAFAKHEVIHTEISKKYSLQEIEKLGKDSGYDLVKHFLDHRHYYALTMLRSHE
jgi:dimethylhistidine N-methyltransferase